MFASNMTLDEKTRSMGVVVANPYNGAASYTVVAIDGEGRRVGAKAISLLGHGHFAFNLSDAFPFLASDFAGSVQVSGANSFVAWTLSSDGGALSSLPEGRASAPISQFERIWLTFSRSNSHTGI